MGSISANVDTAICTLQTMNPCDFQRSPDFSVVLNFFIYPVLYFKIYEID